MDKHGLTGFETLPLARRSDGFSEQFSLPGDDRFWIRFDAPVGDPLIVTDFFPGDLDTYQMAAALLQALAALGMRRPERLVFRNLGAPEAPETAKSVETIERVLDAAVARQRRFIIGRETHIRRGKLDLEVTFKTFA